MLSHEEMGSKSKIGVRHGIEADLSFHLQYAAASEALAPLNRPLSLAFNNAQFLTWSICLSLRPKSRVDQIGFSALTFHRLGL